jgi:hypothetical protein
MVPREQPWLGAANTLHGDWDTSQSSKVYSGIYPSSCICVAVPGLENQAAGRTTSKLDEVSQRCLGTWIRTWQALC